MLKKAWLLLTCVLVVAAIGYAQSGQTGSIVGTAILEDGAAIPGVKVTVTSPAMVIGTMTNITNDEGMYRFANLPSGMYELQFELEGFRTVIRKSIRVGLMQTLTLNAVMKQEEIKEAVVVEGQGPIVDSQHQTKASNWDTEFLKSMPAPRNLAAFVNMAPGMISDGGSGTSAHGSATMDNSYNIDGVNIGDPATGLTNVTFGLDIMDEIAIQTGGLAAEYGSVRGAMLNVVTKSGGNRVTGQASFYFNHEKLKSDNTIGTPLEGDISGAKYQYEPALSIGGPVIKDKLWFFASGAYRQSAIYTSGFPYDRPENVPTTTKTFLPYLKLTFQPDKQNKFIVSYNFSRSKVDYRTDGFTYAQWGNLDGARTQDNPTHLFNVGWTRYFGNNLYANFKVGMVRNTLNIDARINEPQYQDYYTHLYTGGYWRNKDDYKRNRTNINVDATTYINNFLGSHELKIGGEAQIARTTWYVYGVPDPITGACFNSMIGNDYYYGLILKGGSKVDRKDNLDDYFGFLQDTWRVNSHMTINLGLRLEYNSVTWPSQGDPNEGPLTIGARTFNRYMPDAITPLKWTTLAPRFGLIYDLFGDAKTLFKASLSRYTMPNQVGWVNVSHPNGWAGYLQWFNPDGSFYPFSLPWAAPGQSKIGYKDYGLKAPYTDELTIGIERELLTDWSLGVRYMRKWDRRLIHKIDAADLDADLLMSTGEIVWNPLNWVQVQTPQVDPITGQTVTFYRMIRNRTDEYITNPPGAERNYDGLEITLAKRFSRGWGLNASYTYAKSTGLISLARGGAALGTSTLFTNPNAHINAYGNLDMESRHQFKVQALAKGPLGINLSGYFSYLSGLPWTRQVTSVYMGLILPSSVVINAEKRGMNRLDDTVNLDLRLEKVFKIKNINLVAFADCFNVFNTAEATQVWQNSSDDSYALGEMTAINNPRVFQLGARIEFN